MTIGKRLRAERMRLGVSQEKFSALAGVSRRTQMKWENGATSPSAKALEAFARAGADVHYIMTGTPTAGRSTAADRILAGVGVVLDQTGETRRLDESEIHEIFNGGNSPAQIQEFMDEISSHNIFMSEVTWGRALSIIDRYSVKPNDLFDLMMSFSVDVTWDNQRRREKE